MRSVMLPALVALVLFGGAAGADPGGNGNKSEKHGSSRGENKAPDRGSSPDKALDKNDAAPGRPDSERKSDRPGKAPVKNGQASGSSNQHTKSNVPPGQMARTEQHHGTEKPTGPKRVHYKTTHGNFYVPADDRVRIVTSRRGYDWGVFQRRGGLIEGCPPGLAKKQNNCTPPGLNSEPQESWYQPSWYFADWDRNYRYRYNGGYMLRLGTDNSIVGYVPLLAGALSLGQSWPITYAPASLPPYYVDQYGLGPMDTYRFYDDVIYRVDPETSKIRSVAAILAGEDIEIGDRMPAGYEVYNLPAAYRDKYRDNGEAMYRYSDGYIYQIDPTTRLVQAAIELLS